MRTNLENPLIYEPRVSGLRFHNVVMTLTGNHIIPSNGPTVWVYDGGSSDRTVRLPSLVSDKQVVIGNAGATNSLSIADSSGNLLTTLPANTMAVFFAGTGRWIWLSENFLNSVTTRVMTASGNVLSTDVEVQVNSAGATVLTLPSSAAWSAAVGWTGIALSIIDISGQAQTNQITINTSGGQTISGRDSYTLDLPYAGVKLRPKNGGGWLISQSERSEKVTVAQFGAKPNTGASQSAAIQAALSSGAKHIQIDVPGTYIIDSTLTIGANITFEGLPGGNVVLKRTAAGTIINIIGTSTKDRITISDIVFDLNNVGSGIAVFAEWVSNFTFVRNQVKNTSGWGVYVGVVSNVDGTIRNSNVLIEDNLFGPSTNTLEQCLLFNIQDSVVRRNTFTTNSAGGHGLGVFQLARNIIVEENTFRDFTVGMGYYYGISTHEVLVRNNRFVGNAAAIKGAWESDNGVFLETYVYGHRFETNIFLQNGTGLELGGVFSAIVTGNRFEENDNALTVQINNVFVASPVMSTSIIIANNLFRNNNPDHNTPLLSPAILFTYAAGGNWDMFAIITGNLFSDGQAPHTQDYPIAFAGATTWFNIEIYGNRLSSYNAAPSIGYSGGSAAGASLNIHNNLDYTP
jgi:Pectate lyase superfamily protein